MPEKETFLICTVRNATEEQRAAQDKYVSGLEAAGTRVYWPSRDTDQDDPIGLRICADNRLAIEGADFVSLIWDPQSQGSLFDLGMAFALRKPIYLVNRRDIRPTEKKSFTNFLLSIDIGEPSPSSTRMMEVGEFYDACRRGEHPDVVSFLSREDGNGEEAKEG